MTDEQLTVIEQRRDAAKAEVIAICAGKRWRMCIPVEQTDSDICIMNALDDVPALIDEVRRLQHEVERFTLNADDEDAIENLIHRLRRTMADGELYGVEEQIPQMRYILREAFAPLFAEIIKLRASVAEFEQYEEIAKSNAAEKAAISEWRRAECVRLRADIERLGAERDQMVAANVELQERLSAMEDDGK